jgi:predicted RNA-binding Zn-ribbon protein involved in translation (DUF1610 family)
MTSVKPITCPACGSSDLIELAWNRHKCRHCGTESLLSEDRRQLELLGWVCSKCGFNNDVRTTFCGKCGDPLVKICPKCLFEMRVDLEFCSECGANYDSFRKSVLEALQRTLDSGGKSKHGAQYLGAVLKLNPDDKQALSLRGQMHLNESNWRQAIADWGRVYRRDAGYPPVQRQLRQFIDQNQHLLLTRGYVDDRLKDERTRHLLEVIRTEVPQPPPAPGKTSMNLLQQFWPTKARQMEQMYDARVRDFEARRDEIMRAHSEAYGNLLTLAQMCVEGLEEAAERKKQAEERKRQEQAEKERQQRLREAKRQAQMEEQRATSQRRAATHVAVEPKKRSKRRCCCFPLALALAAIPGIVAGLLLWIG